MFRKWLPLFLLLVLMATLAACGGAAAPTDSETATTAAPAGEATDAPATGEVATEAAVTAEVVSTAEPSALEAATQPAVAILCPEVPRPALLLSMGTGFELHNPLSGERCAVPGLTEDIGPEFIGGDSIYFMQRNPEGTTVSIARVGPDGAVELLPGTEASGDTYYLQQFTVAADGSRLAWSQSQPVGGEANPMGLSSTMWLADAGGANAMTAFVDIIGGPNHIATPIRFTGDGQTLYFTWQPIGLGGAWSSFNGRYDNIYRLPAAGGNWEVVFDCADRQLFLCIGDFKDDGTLAYIDAERAIHVVGPDGAEVAAITTADDYAGYPTFNADGDLFYSTAVLPQDDSAVPFPSPGTVYRVAAPYTGSPEVVASAGGVLTAAGAQPFLDATHLVIGYAEGEMWGSALLDTTTGAITRLEPWPNAYLSAVWPAQ